MKILIVKLSSLGDLVHTIAAVNLIREFLPEAKIDWLCYRSYAAILQNIEAIDNVIELENKKLSTLMKVTREIKDQQYDYVIDFQGLIKTAALSFFSGAKVFGFEKPRESIAAYFYNAKFKAPSTLRNKRHVVLQNLDLAKFAIENVLGKETSLDESKIDFGIETSLSTGHKDRKICLIPSTTWQSKLWLPEYWKELIENLHQKYNPQIYILGTMNDMPNIEPIISQLRVPFHLLVDKKLSELPDFFADMDLIIGVDTGPLHIAAASLYPQRKNKKIIGIYGPTSGARSGPFGFENLSYDEISGKTASNKKSSEADGYSLKSITPGHVLSRLEKDS